MKYLMSLFFMFSLQAAASWDGATRGEIIAIEVTAESNYAFRVWLKGSSGLCGNDNKWAYLNKSDSNYETYVTLLTAAKFSKTEVTIYANQSTNNYCKIGHATIH